MILLQQYFHNMIGPSKMVYQETDSQEQQPNKNQRYEEQLQYFQNEKSKMDQKSFYQLGIPVDSYAILNGHKKAVTCAEADPKGIRLATGGLDYHVRLWDFNGMNKNMNSFRIIEAFSGNFVRNIHYNITGTHIMLITGNKQVVMLDKDGAKSLLTVKGYMYIKQLQKTKGHTNTIYDGVFHPTKASQFATCSGDGSIRLWDLQQKLQGIQKELAHKSIIKCRDQKTLLTGITSLSYTMDGKMIFGGCMDGSLQGFNINNYLKRPDILIRDAHKTSQQYTSVLSSQDSRKIITRNTDHTFKVWDLRMTSKAYAHYSNLPNYFPGCKMCWSPNFQYLLVGTAIRPQLDQKEGYLHFYDSNSFQKVKTISLGQTSVCGLTWNSAINQIIAGTSNGQAKIFFDHRLSKKGALQCYNKQPRVNKDPQFDYSRPVYLPFSLPIYQQRPTNNPKKDLQMLRRDAKQSANPEFPKQGPHKKGDTLVAYTPIHHLIKQLNQDLQVQQDARKKFYQISMATKGKREYTMAYQINQSKPVFSNQLPESKQFQFLHRIQKICPSCGLKLCTCANKYEMDSDAQEQNDEMLKNAK